MSTQGKFVRSTQDQAALISYALFGFILVSAVTVFALYIAFRH